MRQLLLASVGLLPLSTLALAGCDREVPVSASTSAPTASASSTAASVDAPAKTKPAAGLSAKRPACEAERARIGALPELPGAPAFEARRGEILGRAKSEAVVFLRPPAQATGLDLRLSLHRDRLGRGSPIMSVPAVLAQVRYFPEDARKLFLSEGYVYAETPEMATTLVDVLKLHHLFKEKEIFLARGMDVRRVARDDKGVYRWADGEQRGEEASLLFGDRLGLSEAEVTPFLHRDLTRLAQDDAPERMRVTRLTEGGALAELRYAGTWIPAALADDGKQLTVRCLAVPDAAEDAVQKARDLQLERVRTIAPVRETVRTMVDEKLRFDEPLKEEGQQDGSLRPLWKWAYDHGGDGYSFNGVGYAVFDASGRPSPPQVCVDFVLDAYERASGTWYGGREQPRERRRGAVDFDATDLVNRRSAAEVVKFAVAHPEMFDVWTPTDDERVPYGKRGEFFASLATQSERFHPGDIVVIHGFKSDGQVHYHSFLIDAIDPISGVPYRLAGNAGRPRLQTWEGVMRAAPMRSIKHLLTPRQTWLTATMPAAKAPALAQEDAPSTNARTR